MIQIAQLIGAVLRWLFKGFRSSLKEEIRGNYDAKWAGSYELENYIIGVIFAIVLIGTIIVIFFI
jgi:hypothetical protein